MAVHAALSSAEPAPAAPETKSSVGWHKTTCWPQATATLTISTQGESGWQLRIVRREAGQGRQVHLHADIAFDYACWHLKQLDRKCHTAPPEDLYPLLYNRLVRSCDNARHPAPAGLAPPAAALEVGFSQDLR